MADSLLKKHSDDKLFSKPIAKNESGVLAGLWRNVLRENHFIPVINVLIDRYVRKYNREVEKTGSAKLKAKSTLMANISSSEMTFKTFLDLIFNFLGVRKINISIKLTFGNGEESVHSISVIHPDDNVVKTNVKDNQESEVGDKK